MYVRVLHCFFVSFRVVSPSTRDTVVAAAGQSRATYHTDPDTYVCVLDGAHKNTSWEG